MKEGDLVLVGTGQAGTVILVTGDSAQVLLRSGEIWTGPVTQTREPQSLEDLEAAPLEVAKPEPRRKRR